MSTQSTSIAQEEEPAQQGRQRAPDSDFYVRIDTTRGPLVLKIFFSIVPYTAGRFLSLVQKHFYDGLTFHRVLYWVVQGGDPNGDGTGNYIDPENGNPVFLKLETSRRLTHSAPGMVAMARSNDPNSASCQFYIIKKTMPSLDGKYAVFGQVVRGIEYLYDIKPGDRIVRASILGPEQEQAPPQQQQAAPGGEQQQPQQQQAPIQGDPGF